MTPRRFLTLCFLTSTVVGLAAQNRDAATPPRPSGTASIAGTVVTDEATPRPLRRATVTLSAGALALPQVAVTDDSGAFVFQGLPAGTYSLAVTRNGYVAAFYGAKHPGKGPGVPIALADGQRLDRIMLKALRGSVISGTVRDQGGQPLVGTQVQVTEIQTVNGQRRANPAAQNVMTDDRGIYRAFGLAPGSYVVLARSAGLGALLSSESRQITGDEIRWAQQATSSNAATAGAAPAALTPAPPSGQSVTYTSVYYPGTPDPASASLVSVGPGEEREGIDFAAMLVPTAKISGTVVDPNGQNPQTAQVSLVPVQSDATDMLGAIFGAIGLAGRGVQDGKFVLTGVTPGRYKLTVRGTPAQPGGAPAAPRQPGDDFAMMFGGRAGGPGGPGNLWASEDITVDGRDISNMMLRLQPGMNVSGQIVYEATTAKPPATFASTQLSLSPMPKPGSSSDPMSSMLSSMMGGITATIAHDGTFSAKGIVPDRYRVQIMGPGMLGGLASLAAAVGQADSLPPDIWTVKSITLDGRDVTDTAFEVRPGEDVTGLVLTLTDRPSELSGRLLDHAGNPALGFPIVVFSTDRTQWTMGSRRVRQVRPSSDGKYRVTGLPAGEYFVGAVTDLDPNDLWDTVFLEQLAASGSLKVTLADGEKKTQDLKLAGG